LLGHRGARHYAPENTLAAFDLALDHGADGFEFDVRCTRNRQAVICHDPKLHRLSVRRHTLKQLQESAPSPDHSPPCLDDVLERYARNAFLNIEIKVRGMEQEILHAVKRIPPRRKYFISSFWPSVVRRLHAMDASLVLGTLAQTRWQLRRWPIMPTLYVVPHYHLLSRRLVEEIHAAGRLVITWTINEPKRMLHAADMGVDGIISDDTRLLVKTLKNWIG
jgi:glycerophosphoryl diester phosphodiesterase